ncbi:MAG: hypothetical protein BYD32DRAFT_423258, partial [Podila humilis]
MLTSLVLSFVVCSLTHTHTHLTISAVGEGERVGAIKMSISYSGTQGEQGASPFIDAVSGRYLCTTCTATNGLNSSSSFFTLSLCN